MWLMWVVLSVVLSSLAGVSARLTMTPGRLFDVKGTIIAWAFSLMLAAGSFSGFLVRLAEFTNAPAGAIVVSFFLLGYFLPEFDKMLRFFIKDPARDSRTAPDK